MQEETPKLEAKQKRKSVVITFRADQELYAAFRSTLLATNSSRSRTLREFMQKYVESVAHDGGNQPEPSK